MTVLAAPVLGPGLPIGEAVRFVVVAQRLCHEAFEILGRRSTHGATLADRVGVAAASRHLGETLPLFETLLPDAVGLKALADEVGAELEQEPTFSDWRASLEADPLHAVAGALLVALRRELEAVAAASSPVADSEFIVVVQMIDVRLAAAQRALGDAALPGSHDTASPDHFTRLVLGNGRKTFSSPLFVPNEHRETTERGSIRSGYPR